MAGLVSASLGTFLVPPHHPTAQWGVLLSSPASQRIALTPIHSLGGTERARRGHVVFQLGKTLEYRKQDRLHLMSFGFSDQQLGDHVFYDHILGAPAEVACDFVC